MLTVHYLVRSRAHRLLWLLEELGLDYDVKVYQRDPKTQLAMPDLLAVHPLGRSPVITDGEVTLAESGAIFEYVLARHGGGRLVPPTSSSDWPTYLYLMHASEGTTQALISMKLSLNMVKARAPDSIRDEVATLVDGLREERVDPYLTRTFDLWEQMLEETEWLSGDTFSAADIFAAFSVELAGARLGVFEGRPRLAAFGARVKERPAYQRAAERGGYEPF